MKVCTRLRISLFLFGLFVSSACLGQDSFGQSNVPLGVLPMQYNSSFAGSNGGPRISSFAGYGRAQYLKSYELYTSYDQFIPAIRSGIGISAGVASQNSPAIPGVFYSFAHSTQSGNVALAIAPKFSIKGKYTLSPSLDFAYGQTLYSPREIYTYPDSILREVGGKTHAIQSRVGILFNTHKFYIGYSVYLVDKLILPNKKSRNGLNYDSYLQAGYTFQRSSTSKFSFTPQVVFGIAHSKRLKNTAIGLGAFNLNFRYNKFIWGFNSAGMRFGGLVVGGPNNRDFNLEELKNGSIHIGWQNERMRLMLTNNIRFLSNSGTTSLSFRYLIPSKMQQKYTAPGTSY